MLTIREVIKTFYNALLQRLKKYRGNWEQNDPTADDYIKNRPFYTSDPVETVLVEESTVSFSDIDGLYAAQFPSTFEATVGETYKVNWDGTAYECTCGYFEDSLTIGNMSIVGFGSDTGEPFIMGVHNGGGIMIGTADTSASHTFSISGLSQEVVKIDAKYLPDLDLAPVAKSGNYYDLNNRPTVYGDVVRYSNQSLTPVQKNVARDNIGAASASDVYNDVIRYSVNQNLTTNQKSVARNNIGASSFSGSYNDLTNKPDIVQGDWDINNDSDMAYIKNRTHYDYTAYTPITLSSMPVASSLINDIYYYGEGTRGSLVLTVGKIYKVSCSNSTEYISTCKVIPIPYQPVLNSGLVLGNARLGADAGYLNGGDAVHPATDTGEPWCFILYSHNTRIAIISTISNFTINSLYVQSAHELKQLDEKYIPFTIQRVGGDVILPSSTSDSDKKFKITVDDSGKPAFTNTSDSADSYTPTDLPTVTASDSGKFLRVSSTGEWVAETVDKAVQPDWNQNDSAAPDYVKNRPFYESIQLTTFLEEQQIDFSSSFTTPEPIVSGETYVVHWDDAEYTIEATSQDIFGDGSIMIPYLEQADGLFEISTVTMTAADKGIHNVAIYTAEIYRKTIDEKLIPDSIARTKSVVRFISGVGPDEIGNVTVSYLLLSDRPSLDKGSKPDSIRQGYLTKANGSCSHAEGSYTEANGDYSHAEGLYTIASRTCQHAEGRYNIEDSSGTYAHIVGNGSSTKRSNAYTLDWQGNAWFAGMVEAPAIILKSSSEGSSKRFKVTIDDSGTLTATEVTA